MFGFRVVPLSVCALLLSAASGLSPSSRPSRQSTEGSLSRRRAILTSWSVASLLGTGAAVASADTGAEVRGTAVTPFNGLIFKYRGSEYGGLDAEDLGEPSVSYADFMSRLKAGEVKFVEFLAPDGDKAYATFVGQDGKTEAPIRIGEGE